MITTTFSSLTGVEKLAIADIDGDMKLDLFVDGAGDNTLKRYEQSYVGSSTFTYITSNFCGIALTASNISPTFTDLNNDGILDLMLGSANGKIQHYVQSSLYSENFTLVTTELDSILASGGDSHPAFTDLYDDGKLDFFIGTNDGHVQYWEAVSEVSRFNHVRYRFNSIDVTSYNTPVFYDLDGDGLMNILIGNYHGNMFNYEQNSVNSLSFTQSEQGLGIDVGMFACPAIADLDGDGLIDLLIGNSDGRLYHYEQDSDNSSSFTGITGYFNSIDVGYHASPVFTDLDGDDKLDLLIGEGEGNINHYEQVAQYSTDFNLINESFELIDVGSHSNPTITDLDGDGLMDLMISNTPDLTQTYTTISHYEQDFVNSTSFTLVTETFNSILENRKICTAFTDINNDGALDFFYGDQSGYINYWKSNTNTINDSCISTTAASSITSDSAVLGGNITDDNSHLIIRRGICYSITDTIPDLGDLQFTIGSGTGSFSGAVSDLSATTTYYYRAFCINSLGTFYGEVQEFTTANGIPNVTTADITDITNKTAISGGTIYGGTDITARGVCWSTSENPTLADSYTVDGGETATYISSITGLTMNTQYYVRAYATNSFGTGYGEQKSFTTLNMTDDYAGSALEFDGTDDKISIDHSSSLDIGNTLTIEAWIKPDSLTERYGIFSTRLNNEAGSFQLEVGSGSGGTNRVAVSGVLTWVAQTDDNAIQPGKWNHIVYTRSGTGSGTHKIYVNGEEQTLISDADYTFVVNNSAKMIGSGVGGGGLYQGKIDELRLWNVVRTQEEIRESMHLNLSGTETGVVSYWQFNEETGTILTDIISGNLGTLLNMTDNDWVDSTIPFGPGFSDSQIEAAGTVDFTDAGLSVYFNSHNSAEITVSRIDTSPNIIPSEPYKVYDQYWVVNRYGSGALDTDLTFTLDEDISIEDEYDLSNIKLYTRSNNAETNWVYLTNASSVNAAADEVTFTGITGFSQFLISKQDPTIGYFAGSCLELDGVDDVVSINHSSSLNIGNVLTIEAWIKPDNLTGRRGIYSTRLNNAAGCFQLEIGSGNGGINRIAVSGVGTWVAQTEDNAIEPEKWNHIVYTRSGTGSGTHKIYVNGEEQTLITDADYTFIDNSSDKKIASLYPGKIDEVRLWDVVRTQEEIRENMYLSLLGTETGLVSYWQFNDGSSTIVEDVISNNNGTMNNMTEDDWINSTIPFGPGFSDSQIELAGSVDFIDTGLSMYFNSHNTAEITVSRIDTSPNIIPADLYKVYDNQYWVVDRYGSGALDTDLTFTLEEYLTISDEDNPSNIKLYTRFSNADTNWVYLTNASSVSATSNEVTFTGITGFSQFIIAKQFSSEIDDFAGSCLEFDGVDDVISIDHDSSLNIDNTLTIEAWIKPDNLTERYGIFSTRLNNEAGSFQLEVGPGSGGTNRVAVTGVGSWVAQTGDNAIQPGKWNHIVYTRLGTGSGTHKIYVNGEEQTLISDADYTFIDNSSDKMIASGTSGGYLYQGKIDELRLWNIVRTQAEIRENMYLPLERTESGFISYWQFNEESGTVLSDNIGGNTGTLFNMTDNDWIDSTLPFGPGFSDSQTETGGTVEFIYTGLSIYFHNWYTGIITVTRLNTKPNVIPSEHYKVYDEQYWVVNRYGYGSVNTNLTFTLEEDLSISDENNPTNFKLYTRSGNADTDWIYLTQASSINAAANEATFTGVTGFSQFIVTKQFPNVNNFAGSSLEFDGTDDYVDVPDNASLNSSSFTVEFWLKPDVLRTQHCILKKSGGGLYWRIFMSQTSGDIEFDALPGEIANCRTGNVAEVGKWLHISASYDHTAQIVKLYANGVLESTATSIPDMGGGSNKGLLLSNISSQLDGQMDEVRLWNVVRTQEEIRENMHLPLLGTETGLVSYWQFNEESGTLTEDEISGNNGTLLNMTDDDWIESTIPFGPGFSDSQIETAGTVDFIDTGLSMYFNSHNEAEITVSRINTNPNVIPSELFKVFDDQYWVVDRYGTGALDTDLTFTIKEDLTISDEDDPSNIKLYTRFSNADTNWVYLATASSVSATSNEATFTGITSFSQFIITKQNPGIDDFAGSGLEFDGSDDYVQTTLDDLSGSEITIEYWFKGSNTQSVVRQQSGGSNSIIAGWNDLHVLSNDGGTENGLPIGAGAEDGNWHHIAMAWKQDTIGGFVSYLDGEIVGQRTSNNTPLPNIDQDIYFGSCLGFLEFMTGTLDEVRIWNVFRDSLEIRENMYLPLLGTEPGLVSYWQFNEGDGTFAEDKITGNHGTLLNMTDDDWIDSTIPFGGGISNSVTGITTGTYDLSNVSIAITEPFDASCDITVTEISCAPNLLPGGVRQINFQNQSLTLNNVTLDDTNEPFDNPGDITVTEISRPKKMLPTGVSQINFKNQSLTMNNVNIDDTNESFDNHLEINVTEIFHPAKMSPPRITHILEDRYWVVNLFGTPGDFSTNLTFTLPIGYLDPGDTQLKLYSRSNSDGSWTGPVGTLGAVTWTTVQFTDITSFSQFTIGSDGDSALPVVLSSLYAQFISSTPTLYWTTQSETNNLGWNIYRSETNEISDASQINSNIILGAGTTTEPTEYIYEDEYEIEYGKTYWYWLESISSGGDINLFGPVSLTIQIEENQIPELPTKTVLHGNYPNPFNPSTIISFDIREGDSGELSIFNIKGQLIEKQRYQAGSYRINWDGTKYCSGLYFYKLKTDIYHRISKMIILK